jgi:hypothetical protein
LALAGGLTSLLFDGKKVQVADRVSLPNNDGGSEYYTVPYCIINTYTYVCCDLRRMIAIGPELDIGQKIFYLRDHRLVVFIIITIPITRLLAVTCRLEILSYSKTKPNQWSETVISIIFVPILRVSKREVTCASE